MSEMFNLRRDEDVVAIDVQTGHDANSGVFTLSFRAGTQWAAQLLMTHMRDRMWSKLTDIRQEAYNRGWKDAKAHRTKESWFSGRWG